MKKMTKKKGVKKLKVNTITPADYFAGCALMGILSGRNVLDGSEVPKEIAQIAWIYSDWMLENR